VNIEVIDSPTYSNVLSDTYIYIYISMHTCICTYISEQKNLYDCFIYIYRRIFMILYLLIVIW
jgi:hypothetical protein